MTRTAARLCADIDCRQPVEPRDLVLRMISSSLEPVAFHAECYERHVPAPRGPLL